VIAHYPHEGATVKTPYWICDDGTAVVVSAMSSAHVFNALTYLRTGTGPHGPMLRWGCSGFTNAEWILIFETQLLVRSRLIRGASK
jgi:hypothetical protein